jgi:hypothetical protein
MSPDELYDPIVHQPAHYKANGMEAIDVIEAFAPGNYHRGNALKYLLRSGKKGAAVQDLQKAVWYLQREISVLAKEALAAAVQNRASPLVPLSALRGTDDDGAAVPKSYPWSDPFGT